VDTRAKLLSADAAIALACNLKRQGRKLLVVTGSFDVLLAIHALDLQNVRDGTGAAALMVVLTPPSVPLLPDRARAELVAALHMVDYVVTAGDGSLEEFLSRLPADEVVTRQAADEEQTRLLMAHVHSRHSL
jgi:bifunctional ADP-heptose synthase (sugar kinase/adenylyltransferase)